MKIILITTITPASENIRGTSALPYHLMAERRRDIDIEVYSYNLNQLTREKIVQVEQELNVSIHLMRQPRWMVWIIRLHLLFLRVFLRLPYLSYLRLSKHVEREIRAGKPDGIWVYGEEIAGLMAQFPDYKRVHIGPDSEALYYYRMLGQRFVVNDWKMYLRQLVMYPKYLRLERSYLSDDTARYAVVGEADAEFIRQMNPQCKTFFLRHPHYDVLRPTKDVIHFHQPVRLLVAGRYDLYMRQSADELMEAFCRCKGNYLKASYEITFLGKGWNMHAERLRQSGWKVRQITFAPNYAESHAPRTVYGCYLEGPDGSYRGSFHYFPAFTIGQFLRRTIKGQDYTPTYKDTAVECVCGADMFLPRSAYDECGGFDEHIFLYGEEGEWQYRMMLHGFRRMLIASPKIVHLEGASATSSRSRKHWDSHFYVLNKYMRRPTYWLARAYYRFIRGIRTK